MHAATPLIALTISTPKVTKTSADAANVVIYKTKKDAIIDSISGSTVLPLNFIGTIVTKQ
ncbi:MAG: hypothetical protein KJ963_00380 [Bacteroidetes bacterium]|nr:hypothetical protein [Bacteroidota bacterium]